METVADRATAPVPAARDTAYVARVTVVAAVIVGVAVIVAALVGADRFVPLFVLVVLAVWSGAGIAVLTNRTWRAVVAVGVPVVAAVLVTLFVRWAAFAAFVFVYVGLVLVAVAGLVRLYRRVRKLPRSTRWIKAGLTVVLCSVLSILVGAWSADPLPILVPGDDETWTVEHLYESERDDRLTGRWLVDRSRDEQRLNHVLTVVAAGEVADPEEAYHAAYLLQHGTCDEHYRLAYELASAAADDGVEGARSLSRSAYDRWLLSTGNAQEYGTQLFPLPVERRCD